jgi:hypothetical protein
MLQLSLQSLRRVLGSNEHIEKGDPHGSDEEDLVPGLPDSCAVGFFTWTVLSG